MKPGRIIENELDPAHTLFGFFTLHPSKGL